MSLRITVVGIGEGGWDELGAQAQAAIQAASLLVGGERHLAMIRSTAQRLLWQRPIQTTLDVIALQTQPVVVLASGEPLWFGAGRMLVERFGREVVSVLPTPGSFSLASAAMGWPLEGLVCRSLHGSDPERDLSQLQQWCYPGARLLLLTRDGQQVRQIAQALHDGGFSGRLWVLSQLGGAAQRVSGPLSFDQGAESVEAEYPALNVVALRIHNGPRPGIGLADERFENDGMLTKRSLRILTLANLCPLPGQLLWDLGAGSGSVAIEWLRAAPRSRAIAVEQDAVRVQRIERNAEALATPQLRVRCCSNAQWLRAPSMAPDAVFIGGGLASLDMIEQCCARLRPGGRLVANAVTVQAEQILIAAQAQLGGSLERVATSSLRDLGRFQSFQPAMPALQYVLCPN